MQLLSSIETNPATPAIGTVIMLHGLGADGNDFAPIVSELHVLNHLALRFVFPNAPRRAVTVNNGYVMPAWYDITSTSIQQRADHKGIAESVEQLTQLINHEKSLGMPSQNIILAGFSQGAVVALATGIHFPEKLGGILALSGYLPFSEADIQHSSQVNHKTPIFIGHGKQDGIVPVGLGSAAYDMLKKCDFNVSWHDYPMAHSVCDQELRDIAAWLTTIFHDRY